MPKIPPYKKPDPERINLTPIPMTPEGIEELRRKLEQVKIRLPALAEEAARTAAYGDRSDNAEYKLAKGALRRAMYESSEIEDKLKRVVPIVRGVSADGAIRIGSVITVDLLSDDKKTKTSQQLFHIVGPAETNPSEGRISNESPLGKALIGHKKEDVVTVLVGTATKHYRVIAVD
ncbi:MAG TPA: GreA/GreB family elongation factor [Candidatus Paceibacterota bacterium]|nr:GreA/GreB family elongation factor [Candidatus Paceibacterota bacterium]